MFASDHGSHFRTRNLEYERSPHDASIRVPLVIAGPGFTGGRRRRDLVTQLDLLPTLVAAAGGDAADVDGTPLQGDTGRGDVFVQISESQIGRAIRTPTHTLAVAARSPNPLAGHLRPAADSYGLTLLYDNVADPHQHRNLARDQASRPVVDELMDLLAQRIAEVEGATPRLVPRSSAVGVRPVASQPWRLHARATPMGTLTRITSANARCEIWSHRGPCRPDPAEANRTSAAMVGMAARVVTSGCSP